MVFCTFAEKLFWEGDGTHPYPQSTVSCKHTLSELCRHQPHSQATPRFYLAAVIKILECPWNEATHRNSHTTQSLCSVVCCENVMIFCTQCSTWQYATNISDTCTCPVKLHITWRWTHFLSMLIYNQLSHCKECLHSCQCSCHVLFL